MDKRTWIMTASAVIIFAVCSAGLVYVFQRNRNLKHALEEKKIIMEQARQAEQELERVRKELELLQAEQERIDTMIPESEQNPWELIRELTELAYDAQAKGLQIEFRGDAPQPAATETAGNAFAQPDEGVLPEGSLGGPVTVPSGSAIRVKGQRLRLSCECDFNRFIGFLKQIARIGRIVSIEGLAVERAETIMPRQKISLSIVAYTFGEQ